MADYVRDLARVLSRIEGLERQLRAPILPYSSLDDASVPEKDAEGNVVSRWGKQEDGTHGVVIFDGPTPPVPAGIEAEGGPVSGTVTWGGTYADDVGRLDFHLIEVYASREPFEHIEDATLVGAIPDPDGGRVTFSRPVGEWYVGLVTLSRAGKRSAVSALATFTATSVVDQAIMDELNDRLDGLGDDLGTLYNETLPALRSRLDVLQDETLPGLNQRLADAEGVLGPLPDAIAAAEAAAATAQGAADDAADAAATAQGEAEAAAQAALDAAGIAEGKGETIVQISPPSGSRARVENLWIRLPDHKVHVYDEDAAKWVAATDPDLITAAQEAAQAIADAAAAAADAAAAATAAQEAHDRAEALEQQVGTLQTDLAAAEAAVANVRDVVLPALDADLATLRDTTIPELEGEVGTLTTALGTLRDETIPDLEAIVGPLPAAVTAAQAAADAAQGEADAARDRLDALRVGSRNLLRNSDFALGMDHWEETKPGSTAIVDGNLDITISFSTSPPAARVVQHLATVLPVGTYTVTARINLVNNGSSPVFVLGGQEVHSSGTTGAWETVSVTIETTEPATFFEMGALRPTLVGGVEFEWVKLERGNVATDWTPAPEDVQAEVDAAQARADDAHAKAVTLEGQVGTLQTSLGEAETAIGTLRDTTLPALNDRLESTEYDLANFSAEWITAGTLDTDRLNANAVAAAVGEFIRINADQITAGLIQGSQIEGESVAAAVGSFLELNANQITAGLIQGSQIEAESIYAAVANLIRINASQINAGEIGADRIAVNDLAAAVATVIELDADRIRTGKLSADRINVTNLAVALATVLSLDAGRITSGTIDTERLDAQAIGALVGEFITLSAEQITAGEIGADRIAVNELFTALFVTNKITAAEADLGSFAADDGFVGALRAATLVVGGPWSANDIDTLPASKIGSGTLNTARVPTLPASKIGSGTLNTARIPNLAQSKITGLPAKLTEHDGTTSRVVGWTTPGQTTIDGGKITTNSIKADQIDALSLATYAAFINHLLANNAYIADLVAKVLTANSVKAEHLDADAVKARNLDVEHTDTTTGNRMSLKPDGLRLWGEHDDGEPTISLTTSEAQQFAILDADDRIVAGMDSEGGVLGRVGSFDELRVDGTDLREHLEQGALGFIYNRYFPHARDIYDAGGHSYIHVDMHPSRQYLVMVRTTARNFQSNAVHLWFTHRQSATSALVPTISSARAAEGRDWIVPGTLSVNGPQSIDLSFTHTPTGSDWQTVGLLLVAEPGTSGNQVRVQNAWWTIIDIGPIANTSRAGGYSTSGGGSAPSNPTPDPQPRRYTKTYKSSAVTNNWRTFQNVTGNNTGSVASSSISGPLQGRTPYYTAAGRYATHFLFNSAQIRADIGNGTVIRARVRPRVVHSHYGSGGTVRLYRHAYTSHRSNWGAPTYVREAHFGRGERRWMDVTTQLWATGGAAGVGFYSNTNDQGYYVQFDQEVELEITYERT